MREEEGMYECQVCGRKYKSQHWLRRHMETNHGGLEERARGGTSPVVAGRSEPETGKQPRGRPEEDHEGCLTMARRALQIEGEEVLSFRVYPDRVVIIEGPVGYKRVWRRRAEV